MSLQRVLPLVILAAAIISVPLMVFSPMGLDRVNNLRAEQRRTLETISRLKEEIRRLKAEVESMKRDPAAVERVARDELGLVRQTEVVFQFER